MRDEIGLAAQTNLPTGDTLFGTDSQSQVTQWPSGSAAPLGYSTNDIVGQSLSRLFPTDTVHDFEHLSQAIAQGKYVGRCDTMLVTKQGDRFDAALSSMPISDGTGRLTGAILAIHDLGDLKRAKQTVSQLTAEAQERSLVLDTASRVALNILASRAGVEALVHIADAARLLAKAQYAALGVARQDGQGLLEFVTVGLSPEQEHAIGSRPMGAGILGTLLGRTEPLRIDRLADHSESIGFPANHPPMDSFLGVPIRREDTVMGSLYLTNKEGEGNFTKADEVAVQALGAHAAVAIHNLHMLSRQRALVSGLINAQEEERRSIAYDLHDGLTQYVMASHIHLEAYKSALATNNSERAANEVAVGVKYLKQAVIESRRLVNGLRPLALDDLGLAGAVEQLVLEEKQRMEWDDFEFVHNIAYRRFDKTLETTAYRIIQEALTNVRKHAHADRVRIGALVSINPDTEVEQVTVDVQDWGNGFEPSEQSHEYGHLGLQGMAERVSLLGGRFELVSATGKGTHVIAVFPVMQEADHDAVEVDKR